MAQSRRHSLLESVINTLAGFLVAMAAQSILYPLYNIQSSTSTNFVLASWFTLLSILRSYFFRRLFNWLHMRQLL